MKNLLHFPKKKQFITFSHILLTICNLLKEKNLSALAKKKPIFLNENNLKFGVRLKKSITQPTQNFL